MKVRVEWEIEVTERYSAEIDLADLPVDMRRVVTQAWRRALV
jgi:hypothetical protein